MSNDKTYMDWPATRAAALSRLGAFIPHAAGDYARGRNFDFGAGRHDKVSVLSPYLRHRLITESEVIAAALDRHDLRSAEKFVQEVMWRGYFKGWLEHNPAVWTRYQRGVKSGLEDCAQNSGLRKAYNEAVKGQTGIACFDHWAEELMDTDYLHNHARMWFASIWIFTLKLPWELGADFFLQHLLDGDPASNTLSWRWVGGLHTRGKTYLARADNIEKFTDGRFNPQGQLASEAISLEEMDLPQRGILPMSQTPPKGKRLGLILHDAECFGEDLNIDAPGAVITLQASAARSPSGASDKVVNFTKSALADGLSRAQGRWDVPAAQSNGDWAAALTALAKAYNLDGFITAYAPTGPVQDCLKSTLPALTEAGLSLTQIIRDYDAALWPYATAGFFKVKKKMPNIIDGLGLDKQGKLL